MKYTYRRVHDEMHCEVDIEVGDLVDPVEMHGPYARTIGPPVLVLPNVTQIRLEITDDGVFGRYMVPGYRITDGVDQGERYAEPLPHGLGTVLDRGGFLMVTLPTPAPARVARARAS